MQRLLHNIRLLSKIVTYSPHISAKNSAVLCKNLELKSIIHFYSHLFNIIFIRTSPIYLTSKKRFKTWFLTLFIATSALLTITTPSFAFLDDESPASRFGSDLVCTAGDVSITGIAVAPGTPTSCVGGTTFTADLDITVNFSTPDRWDIGIFLSNDGGDPSILPANGGAITTSVGILPTSFPFLDLDPNGGLDTCGDGNGAINGGAGNGVVRLSDVPVSCTAIASSGGNLYIPFVVTWDNQSSPNGDDCTSIADPVPNTKSKCNAPKTTVATDVEYGTVNAVVLPDISKTDGVSAVDPGDSISYSVVITNTTGQPLSGAVFTDPAAANISVNSVTCSAAGGATCPTTTVAAMQGSGITVPDMPIDSSITFTIDATVANPIVPSHASTITNTANVTVSSETNSATDINDINGALFSDLSTSTKNVVDLNGGEADPGDTLRYTITLIETEGNPVIGATVVDNSPAGVSNFTVVSIPAGTTDSSTGFGTGANGTGYLDITGIDVAAYGSETIEFDVTIPLGTTAGTLIDNTATITNLGGLGATPVAPTVPVSPSAVPLTDNKQLYLNSTTMTRDRSSVTSSILTVTQNTATVWAGNSPVVLQLDNTIESASATLLLTADSANARQVEARMYCSSTPSAYVTSGVYALGEVSQTTPTPYTFNLTTTVGGFSYPATCPTGDYWVLEAESGNNRDVFVHTIDSGNYSRLNLDSSNVIYVENLLFYDLPYSDPSSSLITTATPGSTIYVRSVISDPFGSFDITDAIIEITDPLSTSMLAPLTSMPVASDSGAATKTFEYAYTLPATPAAGNWAVKVTGLEGDEGQVTDDLISAFTVESLDLELTKTADTTTPAELGNVVYTLTVSNLDTVDTATGIQVTDLLPASLSYVSDTASTTVPPTSYDDVTGIWDIGSLAPATSISITITAQTGFGTAGSTITNTATTTAYDQYDEDLTNNFDSIDIIPAAVPVLTIVKSSSAANANPGDVITYNITVINASTTAAHRVQLDDDMSPYTAFGVDTYGVGSHFKFIDIAPITGLSLGAASFTQDDGGDLYIYIPSSGAGGAPAGFDNNVTDWRQLFIGNMAAGTQFTLEYQAIIK